MSYRNPKQFVDTETAKYYSDLQKTFSGITDDYVKQLNARRVAEAKRLAEVAEQNKKITIARNKYENETGEDINGVIAIRPDLYDDAVKKKMRGSIDIAADISTDMFASQEDKTILQNTNGLNEVMIRDQTNLASYKEEFEEASSKQGQMGGYSVYNDPKQTAFVSGVLGGGLKGKTSFDYDLTKPGGAETMYSWKQEGASEGFSLSGSMIAEIAANPDRDILVKVPNEAESMERTINIFGRQTDEKGDPTAGVQEDLYVGQKEKVRIIRDGNKVIKQYYKEPNMALLGDKIRQKVVASVEALSSNKDLVSNEQIALYNWFQDQKPQDKNNPPDLRGFNEFNESTQEDRDKFLDLLSTEYSTYAMKKYFTGNTERTTGTEEVVEPEEEKLTEGAIKRKIASETAETVLNDMLESPKSYFKDRRINGKKVSDVRILPSTVGRGGEKLGRILEIGYESGTSTAKGERTIFTDEMTFDLDDPVRVRTLIDMLPEGDALKTALKKLTGKKNPLLNLNN